MQREADPRDIHGLGLIAQDHEKAPSVKAKTTKIFS